ncbi:MAG TPA: glycosyltransferase family 4 protein [Chitinophagaceae bacterium]|nr:glycosyltransferase family 4 protein [Chitinophagaceae bacterium]
MTKKRNNDRRLRIAYLTMNDPADKRSWSGTIYYIAKALQDHVGDVHFLGPVKQPWLLRKILNVLVRLCALFGKKKYLARHSIILGRYASARLKRRMRKEGYDCMVAPSASAELCFFKTSIPVIYISDTTFLLFSNYYMKDFRNVSRLTKWEGNLAERRALQKSSLILYASDWAAESAFTDYHISADKVSVIPFGANMDRIPQREEIFLKNNNPVLTLLYLAVEWESKGGDIALECFLHLKETGQQVKLIICGCTPPSDLAGEDIEIIPFLNKNEESDYRKFATLLSTSHFLLLPTRADCFGVVFCEANAYGMPAITTRTGGVGTVVRDGINGYCLSYEARGKEYAALILSVYNDNERYARLVESSRDRFESDLNWEQWAEKFWQVYERHFAPADHN